MFPLITIDKVFSKHFGSLLRRMAIEELKDTALVRTIQPYVADARAHTLAWYRYFLILRVA